MSAKKAKAARRELSLHKFPEHTTRIHIPAVTIKNPDHPFDLTKAKILPAFTYEVKADHYRRIRRLAKSGGLTIGGAIQLYVRKMAGSPRGARKKPIRLRPSHA